MATVLFIGVIALIAVKTPAINDGIATGIGNAVGAVDDAIDNAKERLKEKTKAKEGTTVIPKDKKQKKPVLFPVNPYEFQPVGLIPGSTGDGSLCSASNQQIDGN